MYFIVEHQSDTRLLREILWRDSILPHQLCSPSIPIDYGHKTFASYYQTLRISSHSSPSTRGLKT